MVPTIIRRLLIMIPQLFLISLITFWLGWIQPGDFVSTLWLQSEGAFTWQEVAMLRERLGLDDPWHMQYFRWLGSILRGDLGFSPSFNLPVVDVISSRVGNTVALSITSTITLFAIAVPLGILAGKYYRKTIDKAIIIYGFIGLALPSVVWGLLLLWFFGINLQLLPLGGSIAATALGTGTLSEWISRLRHLILPTMALAMFSGIGTIMFLKAQVVEGTASDYAMTAHAKGVPERDIFNKHILRNSLVPFAPMIGFMFFGLFTGSVLIERIFTFPGMGDLFLSAIMAQDFTLVSSLVLIYSILGVLGVLAGDIILTIVDPRIRVK